MYSIFGVLILLPLLSFLSCLSVAEICHNRVLEDPFSRFDKLLKRSFVGQHRAVLRTKEALSRHNFDRDLLLLHYVGPSGTGKTLLASLVAESFFDPINCSIPKLTRTVSQLLMPLVDIGRFVSLKTSGVSFPCPGKRLDSIFAQSCGVFYLPFARSEDHLALLDAFLKRISEHVKSGSDESMMVLVIDEFNYW